MLTFGVSKVLKLVAEKLDIECLEKVSDIMEDASEVIIKNAGKDLLRGDKDSAKFKFFIG